MSRKTPKWESELWSYVSTGNGIRCPLFSCCKIRVRNGWCFDVNAVRLKQLDDGRPFSFESYDFVERGPSCRVFRLVEVLADRYLKKAQVRCPPVPTELFTMADDQHPIDVHLVSVKAFHGALWGLQDKWVIQLNESDTSEKRRFTLFHEAFHILAHCRASPVFRRGNVTQGSFNELLADYFSISILLPREWVIEKWTEVKDFNNMTRIFDVPKSAMCVRLKLLGLL